MREVRGVRVRRSGDVCGRRVYHIYQPGTGLRLVPAQVLRVLPAVVRAVLLHAVVERTLPLLDQGCIFNDQSVPLFTPFALCLRIKPLHNVRYLRIVVSMYIFTTNDHSPVHVPRKRWSDWYRNRLP